MKKAEVSVWCDDIRTGHLPPICVGTGESATETKWFGPISPPFFVWLLILLLPCWLIVGVWWPILVPGRLPVSARWKRNLRIKSAVPLALIPTTFGLLIAAVTWHDIDVFLWLLTFVSFSASIVLSASRQSLQPHVSRRQRDGAGGPEYVELSNVHPDFAAAVRVFPAAERGHA